MIHNKRRANVVVRGIRNLILAMALTLALSTAIVIVSALNSGYTVIKSYSSNSAFDFAIALDADIDKYVGITEYKEEILLD